MYVYFWLLKSSIMSNKKLCVTERWSKETSEKAAVDFYYFYLYPNYFLLKGQFCCTRLHI